MNRGYIKKVFLQLIVCLLFLLLPLLSKAEVCAPGVADSLLKEYLFPISSYTETGILNSKLGIECEGAGALSGAYQTCSSLGDTGSIAKVNDGKSVLTYNKAKFSYKLSVSKQDNYIFKISVTNDADNFSRLTRQQIDYLLSSMDIKTQLSLIGEGITEDDLALIGTKDEERYQLYRSIVFSVYVDGEGEANKKGFIFIKNTDPSTMQEGSLKIGNLTPGDHTIYLHYLSDDNYYNFYDDWNTGICAGSGGPCQMSDSNSCAIPATCSSLICSGGLKNGKACVTDADCASRNICVSQLPDFLYEFNNADLNKDKKLDTNPIIHGVAINSITPADDVVGIRIYSNCEKKDLLDWYQQNVINASTSFETLVIDGYKAIRDERTLYVNAANLKETVKDNVTYKSFFTNIYVMAYNQAATPTTIAIFNQMLNNWKFNTNITSEEIREKLRRDMFRLIDLAMINNLLKEYYSVHGEYPTLDAGTFVKGHSISTWPSWQATLGNALGSAIPTDPLNIMATKKRGTYDCNSDDPNEKANCVNICSHDANNSPLTGCPADQQCEGNDYCSICPSPYDTLTCWDPIKAKFAKEVYTNCSAESKLKDAFNLGGTKCEDQPVKPEIYDGAYVYQYTSLSNGAAYQLNYRLEYTEQNVCAPEQCYFDNGDNDPTNDCYNPGSCLAGCDDTGANCSLQKYTNTKCLLGNWTNSCPDGFIQSQCGELCDQMVPLPEGKSWCDVTYGDQNWYNESSIKPQCSNDCRFVGLTSAPPRFATEGDSCGGYCGDKAVQARAAEQCDEGRESAPLKRPEARGSGGVSKSSQYMCTGAIGGKPTIYDGSACAEYADYNTGYNTCPLPDTGWVSKIYDKNLLALGGFKVSYKFKVTKGGSYAFKIETANYGDDLSKLTIEQINYLMELKKANLPNVYLYNVSADNDGSLDIPEYGAVDTNDPQKYNLLRSLIYSVYLDNDYVDESNPGNRIGFIIVPATNESKKQVGTINLGNLVARADDYTIYLHFVGDHFYVPLSGLSLPEEINNFTGVNIGDPNYLDVNPILFSATLFSPEADIGSCKTYGGWCGDGNIQLEFGEKCDLRSYAVPTPAETVNIIKNPSFEQVFSPWLIEEGNVSLDTNTAFADQGSIRLDSDTGTLIGLKQTNTIFANSDYRFSLRAKVETGRIQTVGMQISSEAGTDIWSQTVSTDTPLSSKQGWALYQIDNLIFNNNSYRIKIFFITDPQTIIYADDFKLIPLDDAARPQYQCGNDSQTGKICQFKSGYCGDGIIQNGDNKTVNAHENCDDRVGLSCLTNADCGQNGSCGTCTEGDEALLGGSCTNDSDCGASGACAKICFSNVCNDFCRSTYCGDGIIQRPNFQKVYEICDPGSDPTCTIDCQHIKLGGSCSNDSSRTCDPKTNAACRQCSFGLSCSIRNFGDTDKKCLGARGSKGCLTNKGCILGYYCDKKSSSCEPEISTYLQYHPEAETTLPLYDVPQPEPPQYTSCNKETDPNCVTYDINLTKCPDLYQIITGEGVTLISDKCTGLLWHNSDIFTKSGWLYQEAKDSACPEASKLPTITELYSLVRQTNQGLLYADKETLRLCPLKCQYDQFKSNLCADCNDDNYLYWSNTCVERDANQQTKVCEGGSKNNQNCSTDADCPGGSCLYPCTKALAVNFKYGSIEQYKTSTPLKVHCLKETKCGNGILEQGEKCEFYTAADGNLIEKKINERCSAFGYDGGYLHCDPNTCTYRMDNCLFYSRSDQSCQLTCQSKKTFNCKSVGLNIDSANDYYDIANTIFHIADDTIMMGIDFDGICNPQPIPGITPADNCNYKFVNRENNCRDSYTGQLAPFKSEYSYCDCDEK